MTLALVGDLISWAALIGFPTLAVLPIAAWLGRKGALGARAIWIALVMMAAAIGALFAHLAVDLPAFQASRAWGGWLAGVLLFIGAQSAFASPARLADWFAAGFSSITRKTGRAAAWLVIAMVLVQFAVVILRYVFGVNFIFMQEGVTYLHGALFLLVAGYALLTDDHVRVDIFYREASAPRRALTNILGTYVFLFPFCALLIWVATPYVASSWAVREGSTEQSGVQGVFLLKTLLPLYGLLLALAGFAMVQDAFRLLLDGRAADEPGA